MRNTVAKALRRLGTDELPYKELKRRWNKIPRPNRSVDKLQAMILLKNK